MNAFNIPDVEKRISNGIILGSYLTVQAAVALSGYNVQYLRRLLRSGKLVGIKVGQAWLIDLAALESRLLQAKETLDHRCGPKHSRDLASKDPSETDAIDLSTGVNESRIQL